MRRLFSFRSSSGNVSNAESPNKVYWEKPWQSDGEETDGNASGVDNNPVSNPPSNGLEKKDSAGSRLRRSLSFSSPSPLGNRNKSSPSSGNVSQHAPEIPVHHHSMIPERMPKSKKCDVHGVQKTNILEKKNSDSPPRDQPCSSGKSPCSSPLSSKCRPSDVMHISDRSQTLDLYIDGEHQESRISNVHSCSLFGSGCLVENRTLVNSGRPPRAHSTAPSSPSQSKENMKSRSFRDAKDVQHFHSKDSEASDFRSASPLKPRKKFAHRLSHAFTGRPKTKSREYDSESTTIEDIYEDTFDQHRCLSSDESAWNCGLSEYYLDPQKNLSGCSQNMLGDKEQNTYLADNTWDIKNDDDIDKQLELKLKEAEKRFMMISDVDDKAEKYQTGDLCLSDLLETIKAINADRKKLSMELLIQLQRRKSERYLAKEALKQAQFDYVIRKRRLEKEKNDLQLHLEKELDRRSSDWLSKFEKFQAEEQRLRERVRELAEQNVSLQREVSSLKGIEGVTCNKIMNMEIQLGDLSSRMEELQSENQELRRALLSLQDHIKLVEEDRDFIQRSYEVEEKENKELQKVVVRFQRTCNEQEKTISGLRKTCLDELINQPSGRGDLVSSLQTEQVRLTNVEQTLRKEVESCRHELKSLQHENAHLLDRLQGTRSAYSFRLEDELHARVDCLQNQGVSLLHESNELCVKLLKSLNTKSVQQLDGNLNDCYNSEYSEKFQCINREFQSLKRSLQTVSLILDDKSDLESSERLSQSTNSDFQKQPKILPKDNIELELKEETLMTKLLREKLCSKELEFEQLQSELASSIRIRENLKSEIQLKHDEVSILNHRVKDYAIQMQLKDENFVQLQNDLAARQDTLTKVSKDRDRLWEDVKQLKEMDIFAKYESATLKKKIEALEEDVLIKDGQISILKDSIGNKSFETLYPSKYTEEHILEQ